MPGHIVLQRTAADWSTVRGYKEGMKLWDTGLDDLLQIGTCFTGNPVKGRAYNRWKVLALLKHCHIHQSWETHTYDLLFDTECQS